jgi:hypothetical protein
MFVRCFALTFLFLSSFVFAAPDRLAGDTFHHGDLRISVTKPADWRFLTSQEKRAARYANTYKNKEYDSLVKLDSFPPRIVISKYPEPRAGLNPSVSIDRYPLDDLRFTDEIRLAHRALAVKRTVLNGIEVVEPVRFGVLGGVVGGYFRVRYTLEVRNGSPLRVDERVWVIGTGLMSYLVKARAVQDGPDAAGPEMEAILSSITFDPKMNPGAHAGSAASSARKL